MQLLNYEPMPVNANAVQRQSRQRHTYRPMVPHHILVPLTPNLRRLVLMLEVISELLDESVLVVAVVVDSVDLN